MFLFRSTSNSRQPINSFLGLLRTNQICKSYLKVLDIPQTVFYCCLRENLKISATPNKLDKIDNDDNNRISCHTQQNMDLHKKALHFQDSMRKIHDIEKLYPAPMSDLLAIYNIVNTEFDEQCLSVSYSVLQDEQVNRKVKCVINVKWPSDMSFSYEAANKKTAGYNAALTCLQWLYENKKITKLKPVVYNHKDIQNILRAQRSMEINLEPEFKNEIQTLIHAFNQSIEPVIKEQPMINSEANNVEETKFESKTDSPFYRERNNRLARQLQNRQNKAHDLPVYNYKQTILDILKHNQVLLIKGNTGCGKSTQVPQFIMDEYTKQNRASECNIIVTQPRRVAAIALAHRIASERNEEIGDVIGYHVRFNSVIPKSRGSIVFSTAGILLRMLESNPTLERISHVIVDEAHERNLQIDILLKLIKEILRKNQSIKLIIMSATVNENLFQRYFSCNVIDIPGKLYPVKMHFKEDIPIFKSGSAQNDLMKLEIPFNNIVRLVQWIITNKPPGCILCFLPGWQEIKQLHDLLQKTRIKNLLILPLHSKVPHHIQLKAFDRVPTNITKVILATDIAECSITIEDVSYVIDTAIKREYQWYGNDSQPVLNFNLISKANIHQRKGRAGRVKPGESYHLITKEEYNTLDLYPKPEIFTVPLENAIIIGKKHSDEKVYDFFSSMLQSPGSKSIFNAVKNLKTLGILDDDENLTDLGKRVSYFSLDPKLSKAIVLSCVFQCLKPILLLVSLPFGESSVVSLDQKLSEKSSTKLQKLKFHKTSDHIAMLRYYDHWNSSDDKFESVYKPSYFSMVNKYYKLHATELVDSGMFHSSSDRKSVNMFSNNYELIRAVLFAATNHLIRREEYGYRSGYFTKRANKLISEDTAVVDLNNESVNHKRKEWPSEMMTYFKKRKLSRFYAVSETSMLTPLSVFLFSHNDVRCYRGTEDFPIEQEKVYIEISNIENVQLCCDRETAILLLQFRSIIWDLTNYVIKYEGVNTNQDNLNVVKSYKTEVMTVVANMLHKLSKNIDSSTK